MAKPKKTAEPKIIRPDDIDPHHNWKRPLQAPGHTQVDFEERINFRRLHDYRLARVRSALATQSYDLLLADKGGLSRDLAPDLAGMRTVLRLRSKFGSPRKSLTDPLKYVDLSYYEKALGKP